MISVTKLNVTAENARRGRPETEEKERIKSSVLPKIADSMILLTHPLSIPKTEDQALHSERHPTSGSPSVWSLEPGPHLRHAVPAANAGWMCEPQAERGSDPSSGLAPATRLSGVNLGVTEQALEDTVQSSLGYRGC